MRSLERADEAWIPELGGNAKVLAAAHERIAFGALGRGGDAVGVKVVLLPAGNGDQPPETQQRPLPTNHFGGHDALPARSETPPSGSEGPVQNAPVLDLGEVQQTIWPRSSAPGRERITQQGQGWRTYQG